MAPVVALEPLTSAVLGLATGVIILAVLLLIQRGLALLARARASRREPLMTRQVYEVVQTSPLDPQPLVRLSRFDRKLVRSIVVGAEAA